MSDSFPPDLDFDTTIFSSEDESFLQAALQLVSQLRQLHYYTDTATFSLRCETCSTALVGEKDARAHAEATGHTQFGEFEWNGTGFSMVVACWFPSLQIS